MTTTIITPQPTMSAFDRLIQQLNTRYDHYPTRIKKIPLSAEEKSETAYYDAYGRYAASVET